MQRLALRAAILAVALPFLAARAEDLGGQKEFRDLFFTLLQQDNKMSPENARKLLYALPQELRSSSATSLDAIDALYRKHRPSELYTAGAKVPSASVNFVADFKHGPVLLVVVPGVFGEFIAHSPFEEAFTNQNTAFAKQFHANLARLSGADATDPVFSLATMKFDEQPLTKVLDVTSIDDAHGKPLVKAVFLKPNFASLETLGTLEENAAIYDRRLNKLFKVIGAQPFYLIGYSRGLTVALELAAEKAKTHWGHNLKGVVSHAGVVYGTPLADASFQPGNPTYEMLQVLLPLLDKLHDQPPVLPDKPGFRDELHVAKIMEEDWAAWAKAGLAIAHIEKNAPKADAGIALEKIKLALPGARSTFKLIKEFAWDQFKIIRKPELTHLEKSQHFENVARFKAVVRKVYAGVTVLTTKSRVDWFKKHTLPADLTYYSIGATMADQARPERANKPLFDAQGVCALSHDPISTSAGSIDWTSLRPSYYQLADAGKGMELNDSQVPLQRVRFWPHLARAINPAQHDFRSYFLGVLGADHWGMSFPRAIDQHNHVNNPFPRATLLKAMGAFIASHP